MEGTDRSQLLLRLAFPFSEPLHGLILPVRLGDTEVEVSRQYGVDIKYRSAGGFDRRFQIVLFLFLVDGA